MRDIIALECLCMFTIVADTNTHTFLHNLRFERIMCFDVVFRVLQLWVSL